MALLVAQADSTHDRASTLEQEVAKIWGKGPMATRKRNDQVEHQDELAVADKAKTEKPRRYQVVLHNDDYTTMEFVVHVLMKFFHKDETEATRIMLHVHHRGFGVVGLFTRDVAETKANQVMDYAKQHGHPLRCTAEPEGFGESE
jgi:ATP-dependent Clp protease adaptor protein ClpS